MVDENDIPGESFWAGEYNTQPFRYTKRRLQDVVRFLYMTKQIGNMYFAPTEIDFSTILAFSVPRLLLFVHLRLTVPS